MIEVISEIKAKDIVLVLLGAGVTISLFLYKTVKEYLDKYRWITPLINTWHTYHFSRSNFEPVLRIEKWIIKRNLFGVIIETHDADRTSLVYKGSISFDSSHVVISMKGVSHTESVQYRMTQPIPNDDTMMLGFHVGKDFDHELYSTFKLICLVERAPEEAMRIIREAAFFSESESCMRLSKKPTRANN